MHTANQKTILEERIATLQNQQVQDLELLKNQYQVTVDSLKPINLIKSSLQEVITTPNLKSQLISGAIGLGTNYLSKIFMSNTTQNPIKGILGKVFRFTLKKFVGKK